MALRKLPEFRYVGEKPNGLNNAQTLEYYKAAAHTLDEKVDTARHGFCRVLDMLEKLPDLDIFEDIKEEIHGALGHIDNYAMD